MGLFSKMLGKDTKPKKSSKLKVVRSGDWEVYIKDDGTPTGFYKKGKEWLDPGLTWSSPSRNYFLHQGFDGNGDECIALTTQLEGLKLKKTDGGVEAALVLDDGTAYVLTDECNLVTITPERSGQKALAEEAPDAYILTPEVCVVTMDEGEVVTVKAVDLSTGKSWRKAIKYEWPEDGDNKDVTIASSNGCITVTTPDGTAHLFNTAGEPLKK